jgi:hypothetical protein
MLIGMFPVDFATVCMLTDWFLFNIIEIFMLTYGFPSDIVSVCMLTNRFPFDFVTIHILAVTILVCNHIFGYGLAMSIGMAV